MSARDLLRRPDVRYTQVAQLAQRVAVERAAVQENSQQQDQMSLPMLEESTAEEVELQSNTKTMYANKSRWYIVRSDSKKCAFLSP